MLQLFSDTDLDLTPEKAREYGYKLISMPFSIDGETTYPYADCDTFDMHAFYEKLRNGVVPNTSAISEESYRNYFEPCFANGDDILYVHFSRKMSATFENMDRAVKSLKEKYPERKFYTVDTKGITILGYIIALCIGDMVKQGKGIDEILEWSEAEIDKYAVYFFSDDLKFFHQSGRVSGLAATMGTMLGVRPIIYMSSEGKMESIGKERGRQRAINRLIHAVEEIGDDVANHRVVIGNTDNREIAQQIADALYEKYGKNTDITIIDVNPTAGSHCGPDSIGIAFHSKHR